MAEESISELIMRWQAAAEMAEETAADEAQTSALRIRRKAQAEIYRQCITDLQAMGGPPAANTRGDR